MPEVDLPQRPGRPRILDPLMTPEEQRREANRRSAQASKAKRLAEETKLRNKVAILDEIASAYRQSHTDRMLQLIKEYDLAVRFEQMHLVRSVKLRDDAGVRPEFLLELAGVNVVSDNYGPMTAEAAEGNDAVDAVFDATALSML